MRSELGIRPAVELVRAAETNGPAWIWSGVGNVGLNKYCLAWQRGKLYYSAHDEPVLASGWEFDACVWVHTNGWQVRFERVSFVRRGSVWEPLIAGETVSGVQLILTGQRLVERGTPIDPTRDANSRHAVSYVDKRHIVLNAYTRVKDRRTQATAVDGKGEPIKRDFGLDQILDKHELLKAAIEGAVVPLRLELQAQTTSVMTSRRKICLLLWLRNPTANARTLMNSPNGSGPASADCSTLIRSAILVISFTAARPIHCTSLQSARTVMRS
jgi:hypothetical protein